MPRTIRSSTNLSGGEIWNVMHLYALRERLIILPLTNVPRGIFP